MDLNLNNIQVSVLDVLGAMKFFAPHSKDVSVSSDRLVHIALPLLSISKLESGKDSGNLVRRVLPAA